MSPQAVQKMIADHYADLSPELKRAASWVSRHGSALALHSMRASARAADVTPATMTRLAHRLGFDGFEAFRAPFRRELARGHPGAELERMLQLRRGAAAAAGEMAASLNSLQQSNVASVLSRNPIERIEAAARAILEASQVSFLGLRVCHGIATYLAYAYGLLRANGHLISGSGGMLGDQIARIGEGHVLVAVSQAPYMRATVEGVELAVASGAAVVALTDSALSPLAGATRHVLLYDTASAAHFHSTVGAQALGEVLIAAIAAHGGAQTMAHLRRVRNQLQSSGAYWDHSPSKE